MNMFFPFLFKLVAWQLSCCFHHLCLCRYAYFIIVVSGLQPLVVFLMQMQILIILGTQKQLRYLKRLLVSQSTIIFLSIVSGEFSLMLASANYVEVILLPSQILWSDTRCVLFCHKILTS
jgi:hypothetical protein